MKFCVARNSVQLRLCGGLGNQVFQYAAGRSPSLRLKVPLFLELNWFEEISGDTTHPLELHRYPICATWGTGGGAILPTLHDGNGYAHAAIGGSATMLEDMWRDAHRRRGMADARHAAWLERFTWGKIADDYEHMFPKLMGSDK